RRAAGSDLRRAHRLPRHGQRRGLRMTPPRSSRRTTARTSGGGRGPGPGGARRALVPPARIGDLSTRHRLLISIILVAVLALSGRLIWVQGLDASARAEEAIAQRTVTRTIPALRGDITDRHGDRKSVV